MIVEFKDKNPGSTGLSHEHQYYYIGDCKMKDSAKGWINAAMYSEVGHPDRVYIRDKEDFVKKFKEVDDNEGIN